MEHVEGLTTSDLSDDDPVGPHAEGVADQCPNGHLADAFHVRGSCLQGDHVRLRQSQLRGVFDGDQPLLGWDERGQHAEERGLAGTGSTRDHDVGSSADAVAEERHQFGRDRAHRHQILRLERAKAELPDRHGRAAERKGRDDRVHPRPVREPSVHVR